MPLGEKKIETHARAFLTLNILAIGRVGAKIQCDFHDSVKDFFFQKNQNKVILALKMLNS